MRSTSALIALAAAGALLAVLAGAPHRSLWAQKPPATAPAPFVIPSLTDEDRTAAVAIIADDPAMRPFLEGRAWNVVVIGVWHIAELKLGAGVVLALDPPASGTFEAPAVLFRRNEEREEGGAIPTRRLRRAAA
jgi:hypothetical protein